MTNREWLFNKMQNMSDEEFAYNAHDCVCDHSRCKTGRACMECKLEWLKAEHKEKITLSEAERIILENIDKEYKWIARDENKNIFIYSEKPDKKQYMWKWIPNATICFTQYNHLFQFITWNDSEPYNIEELLKGDK